MTESSTTRPQPPDARETLLDQDAAPTGHVADPPLRRPKLGRMLWYCYGGSVPAESHSWVLHDVTCRTWILRHFARWTMVVAPLFTLYMVFMPTEIGMRTYTGIAFSFAIYVMSFVFILIDTDRRAVRAGYAHSQPQAIRTTNNVERQRTTNYQRRERIAARRARRGR